MVKMGTLLTESKEKLIEAMKKSIDMVDFYKRLNNLSNEKDSRLLQNKLGTLLRGTG